MATRGIRHPRPTPCWKTAAGPGGRNAAYLAGLGCAVDAVDFSARAIEWAQDRARRADASVTFQCCSTFDAVIPVGSYDLVYDSGCFHHLFPDRRQSYSDLVQCALRPGGSYGLVCFRPEGGRQMSKTDQQEPPRFGEDFLWALLATKTT